jgi:hypothetical protein
LNSTYLLLPGSREWFEEITFPSIFFNLSISLLYLPPYLAFLSSISGITIEGLNLFLSMLLLLPVFLTTIFVAFTGGS